MSEAHAMEKTKPAPTKAAPAPMERLMVLNDKGGIGKSIVIQGLSLELAAERGAPMRWVREHRDVPAAAARD